MGMAPTPSWVCHPLAAPQPPTRRAPTKPADWGNPPCDSGRDRARPSRNALTALCLCSYGRADLRVGQVLQLPLLLIFVRTAPVYFPGSWAFVCREGGVSCRAVRRNPQGGCGCFTAVEAKPRNRTGNRRNQSPAGDSPLSPVFVVACMRQTFKLSSLQTYHADGVRGRSLAQSERLKAVSQPFQSGASISIP